MEWHWWQAYRLRCVSAWCVVVRLHYLPIYWKVTGGGCMAVVYSPWQTCTAYTPVPEKGKEMSTSCRFMGIYSIWRNGSRVGHPSGIRICLFQPFSLCLDRFVL